MVMDGLMDGRTMETPTGRSAPSNPHLTLPEVGPGSATARLFSSPPAWIHPAQSGPMPTQIGCLELGLTHMQAADPGQRLELLIQVSDALVKRLEVCGKSLKGDSSPSSILGRVLF